MTTLARQTHLEGWESVPSSISQHSVVSGNTPTAPLSSSTMAHQQPPATMSTARHQHQHVQRHEIARLAHPLPHHEMLTVQQTATHAPALFTAGNMISAHRNHSNDNSSHCYEVCATAMISLTGQRGRGSTVSQLLQRIQHFHSNTAVSMGTLWHNPWSELIDHNTGALR